LFLRRLPCRQHERSSVEVFGKSWVSVCVRECKRFARLLELFGIANCREEHVNTELRQQVHGKRDCIGRVPGELRFICALHIFQEAVSCGLMSNLTNVLVPNRAFQSNESYSSGSFVHARRWRSHEIIRTIVSLRHSHNHFFIEFHSCRVATLSK
jgi:hypothetical protein